MRWLLVRERLLPREALCKLFLSTGNATRILFLVDRIELEDQAVKAFKQLFEGEYFVTRYKDGNWNKCQIVVSTVQSLLANNKYREEFSPTDFELVISDEAHRSIGGNARAVFEYFLGYKLGLTATPKDYIKGVDERELKEDNPKAYEQRHLRDTYRTFGCEGTDPTYRYDLKQGSKDGFLIQPYVIDARTNITTDLLSEEGYAVQIYNDEGSTDEVVFGVKNFEKTFFNEDTNRVICQTILDRGLIDPLTGEFGKTLVFAVSQAHASKLVAIFNRLARSKWPHVYQSDFAVQVTSFISDSQKFTKDFSNNKLLGKSRFAQETYPDYPTSRARICVTVGMMTTGYDCPDLMNIAMVRPVFSPSDFIQMKGRGTRPHTFEYQETGETTEKTQFMLFDFFGNYTYFEKDFDYQAKIELPIGKSTSTTKVREDSHDWNDASQNPGIFDAEVVDMIASEQMIMIGVEGMKIDRNLYPHQQFEQIIQQSQTLQDIHTEQGIEGLEEYIKTAVFNRPSEYWTADKIRISYEKEHKTKRKISLTEMILKALGLAPRFKTRQERLEEEYQKFVDIQKPQIDLDHPEKAQLLRDFFETHISDTQFRTIIESGRFAELSTIATPITMEDLILLNGAILDVVEYTREYLNRETQEFNWITK